MAKTRYIDTRFWHDTFIREHLNPLDRYLFLYFLTNDKTNISGIYELPMSIITSETGLEKEMIEKMLKRFESKIHYVDGWIYVVNFQKYQNTENPKIKRGIENELSKIPSKIRIKIEKLNKLYKLSIPYLYPMDSPSHSNSNSNSNLNTNINTMNEELTYDYSFEGKKKRVFKKVDEQTNKMFIAIGCLWVDMVIRHFQVRQEEVPIKSLVLVIRRCWEREKWGFDDFKKLFTYFLSSKIPEEDKMSFDLCLSQKYVAKYKIASKNKNKTYAGVSNEIKL